MIDADDIKRWKDDPVSMVPELFGMTPDPWQATALQKFATEGRLALVGSKGVGCSITLAWMAWNFVLTRPEARVVVGDISYSILQDNLWFEIRRMHGRSARLNTTFGSDERAVWLGVHKDLPSMSTRPVRMSDVENTFAGIFAKNVLLLLDNSSSMPVEILSPVRAIMDNALEAKFIIAGIPSESKPPRMLEHVVFDLKWPAVHASGAPDDPDRSPRVSEKWARQQIAEWGIDNPWVRAVVLGKFPTRDTP